MSRRINVIIADVEKVRREAEVTALLEMYTHLFKKVHEFNNFNKIVNNVSGFKSYVDIDGDINVNREMFDKLYYGATLLKLPIDMTFNYDTELWYLTIKYNNVNLCFVHNDNLG